MNSGKRADGTPAPMRATSQEIIAQRNQLEQQVRELTQKRHDHAYAWAKGDQKAWDQIEAIDKQRAQLGAQIEALSQAITLAQREEREARTPGWKAASSVGPTEQIKQGYLLGKPRHVKMLRSNIQTEYDSLALSLQNAINGADYERAEILYHGGLGGRIRYPGLAGIPRASAAHLTGEAYWRRDYDQGVALKINKESLERIKVSLDATIWCTDDLLASVEPPPLSDYLKEFPERFKRLVRQKREAARQIGGGVSTGITVWQTNIPRKW